MRRRIHACVVVTIAILVCLAPGSSSRACDPGVELLITEFMAQNNSTLADEDGDYSDWIEIHNPCLPDVDLGGWSLTDDPANLTKWQFPSVHLVRGQFLMVFASGKNRAVAGAQLHTSFKLAVEGEYLALVRPDGTVAQSFSPTYPPQYGDVSCGLPQTAYHLMRKGDAAAYHVPAADDAALGTGWAAAGFDDSAWSSGPTGLGFTAGGSAGFDVTYFKAGVSVSDLATAEAVIADPALQSSVSTEKAPVINYLNTGGSANFGNDRPFPSTQIGVDVNDFVVEATGTILIPTAGSWTFGVNSDDGFSLELGREPYSFFMSFPNPRAPDNTFAAFEIPEPGAYDLRLVFYERGGGSEVELFAASGSYTVFTSAFKLVGDVANGGLQLSDISSLVGTDVGSVMRDVNSSLWSRHRFDVADPSGLGLLEMRMAYEDGFVAYLNGTEVASRNAPPAVQWDSVSLTDKSNEEAGIVERIDLSDALGLLHPGANVLAIHGLNDSAADPNLLVLPDLRAAAETADTGQRFFFTPSSPGSFNEGGYPGVSGSTSFSRASCMFTDSFSLSLTTASPGATIRYTLDGTDPSASNGTVYTGPLSISDSTRVRARAFEPGLAPGPVVTRLYVKLGQDVVGFNSNLPLVVVHTFGGWINQTWLTENLIGVVPTSSGRASITAPPEFVGRAGIRIRGSSSAGFPKKQYTLETWDENRHDLDATFLGLPPESDWILFGPYDDKTLMRDVLSYKWSNDIGRYAVRTRFVEMYLRMSPGPVSSGDYVGVYVVMEKIKQDPARVNITDILPGDATPPAVTGGYITKKDRLDPGDSGFYTSRGQRLCYVEPKEDEITTAQGAYLGGYYNDFETALYGSSFADPVQGYANYIDVDSWIDHHWLVEMTKNIDGFRLSTFMFKDRGAKLNMGPIWDYNLCLGNANYLEGWLAAGWYNSLLGDSDYPWWRRLFQDPEFKVRYWDRWYQLRMGPWSTDRLLADIEAYALLLNEAQARNFQRWPVLGIYTWPNWFIGNTYREEIDWMKAWLEDRLEWIDGRYSSPPVFDPPAAVVPTWTQLTMVATAGTIYYTLDGTDPRVPGGGISPSAIAYSGPLDLSGTTHVKARALDNGSWSAIHDATYETRPRAYVNEVLPENATVRSDEHGEFDPWIELYNPFSSTADLSGMFLTDDPATPDKWPIPAGTGLCGQSWLLVWADGEPSEGVLHASFRLNPAGGTIFLFDQQGRLVDSLTYPPLGRNVSYGRSPDGGTSLSQFLYATPDAANSSATTRILVNEYNGVSPDKFLAGSGTDTYWGRVMGNGGDWFELVVVQDHLDLRGWQAVVQDAAGPTVTTLTFSDAAILSDLRSGTIVTVAENLASDVSYDPVTGDWWINLRSGTGGDGAYVSALDFTVSNQNTQVTLRDASGTVAFGPAGEGINPLSGVGNDEVLKLEENPGVSVTAFSNYNDGTSSTFGSPNRWNGGLTAQDFSALRSVVPGPCSTDAGCNDSNPCTDDTCVGNRCQNVANSISCDDGNPCTAGDACTERQCRGLPMTGCCFSDCECDDGSVCTIDTCISRACIHTPSPAGTACDDGIWCTVADTCSGGACGGAARDCSDGDACTDDGCAEAGCGHVVNGVCSIAGTVRYYRDGSLYVEPSGRPVPTVSIDRTQDAVADAVTDGNGAYAFVNLSGQVTVGTLDKWGTPRASDHNDAISSLDAVYISRHAVGIDSLSPNQQIAGDVTGNGELSSFDAAKVAQFAVELVDHFDVAAFEGSDWRFLRCDHYTDATHHDCAAPVYVHPALTGTATDDFFAILYGDVTGNWQPAVGFLAGRGSQEERAAAEADRQEAERLRRTGTTVSSFPTPSRGATLTLSGWRPSLPPGSQQDLLLSVSDGDGIEAFDFTITYDTTKVAIADVRPTGLGGQFRTARNDADGKCRLGMYAVVPIRGSGPLLTITVRLLAAPGPKPPLSVLARANEGQIPLSIRLAP